MAKDKDELATDQHGPTRTFVRRTSPNKNSHRFAKRQRSEGRTAGWLPEGRDDSLCEWDD